MLCRLGRCSWQSPRRVGAWKRNNMASELKTWMAGYLAQQKAALDSIPLDAVSRLIDRLRACVVEDRQIFVFGNGGSAANASHFATDLGKGSSDKIRKRFRVSSLND